MDARAWKIRLVGVALVLLVLGVVLPTALGSDAPARRPATVALADDDAVGCTFTYIDEATNPPTDSDFIICNEPFPCQGGAGARPNRAVNWAFWEVEAAVRYALCIDI